MKIALTGNPNSGKTTLFNAITGQIEHVGNWPGVTVEKKEGDIKASLNSSELKLRAVDLPGAYSIAAFTSEESITSEFVKGENPDVIINVVDYTNLSRSLFFTTQLLELGIPVVVALNKSDLAEKKEISINIDLLAKKLNCPVVNTIAIDVSDNNLKDLIAACLSASEKKQVPAFKIPSSKNQLESDQLRYEEVNKIVNEVEIRKINSDQQTFQDSVDRVIAHKWLGIPIFMLVMWLVFAISQEILGPFLADILAGWIDSLGEFVAVALGDDVSLVLSSLLVDGIIGGVGAVVGFLPLIMVLFFLLALLEDCGYMARVAVVMDKFFKKVGLSGKSIIPMIIGTGCAIPGVMATRTIKNERQRRTTAMLTPFMPCGAKLPVIALFAGVFFNDSAWIGTSMYFVAIVLIIFSALLIQRITGEKNARSLFIMELPDYRFPSIKRAIIQMFSRAKAFIIKAGTIILLSNVVVQLMQTFNWQFEVVVEGAEATSILASIATPFAFLLIPLGFGVWQLAAAAITGFIAKENVVGTLAVVYSLTNFIDTEEFVLTHGANTVAEVMGISSIAALAYLMFNLFTPPCFAAMGAMNSEMESKKWLWSGIAFQFSMGYIVAFLVYQIGTLLTTGTLGTGFVFGLVIVSTIVIIISYLVVQGNKKSRELLESK
ncbi:MAG: ferrous iron transporter B [Erysipelotrichaceae bacterium]